MLKQPSQGGVYKPTRERLVKARNRINEWRKSLPAVDDSEYMAFELELYRTFEDLRERANSVAELA